MCEIGKMKFYSVHFTHAGVCHVHGRLELVGDALHGLAHDAVAHLGQALAHLLGRRAQVAAEIKETGWGSRVRTGGRACRTWFGGRDIQ